MTGQRTELPPFLCISDCESHGHRMPLSVFQSTWVGTQTKRSARVAKDIPNPQKRLTQAPTGSSFRPTSSPRFPENCTKPIKEDSVAFHAA